MTANVFVETMRIAAGKLPKADLPIYLMNNGEKLQCEIEGYASPDGLRIVIVEQGPLGQPRGLKERVLAEHGLL